MYRNMAGINHALLRFAKDAVGKELGEPGQINLSTPFNPGKTSEIRGFVVVHNELKVSISG